MARKLTRSTISRRGVLGGILGTPVALAAPRILHAGRKLKIATIYPFSGLMAEVGITIRRVYEPLARVLKQHGFPEYEIVEGDTESRSDTARTVAEKLVRDGAHVLVGCFDSAQTMAAAQVSEQQRVPLVVPVASADRLTDAGYTFLSRLFPTSTDNVNHGIKLQKQFMPTLARPPKSAVMVYSRNPTGEGRKAAEESRAGEHPYTILSYIGIDPKTHSLNAEVRKAKTVGADIVLVSLDYRLFIQLIQQMVIQRWEPAGIISVGPGGSHAAFQRVLGAYAEDVVSIVPWGVPTAPLAKVLQKEFEAEHGPTQQFDNTHSFHAAAIQVVLDAYVRSASVDPEKLNAAIRTTRIHSVVGPVSFKDNGQNSNTSMVQVLQNKGGKTLSVFPPATAEAKLEWPMRPWNKR